METISWIIENWQTILTVIVFFAIGGVITIGGKIIKN